jgi:hypothetical protein
MMKTLFLNLAGWLFTVLAIVSLTTCVCCAVQADTPTKAATFAVLAAAGFLSALYGAFSCGGMLAEHRRERLDR